MHPTVPPIPPRLTTALRRVAIIVLLVLVPLAAGLTAVAWAPPAQVHDVGLDGLSIEVKVRLGDNSTTIDSGVLGGLRRPGISLLGKHIGLSVRPDDVDLALFDAGGALDAGTIDVAGHLFADPQARQDELDHVRRSVIRYYGTVGLGTTYFVAMIEILGYAYLKSRRRRVAALTTAQRELLAPAARADRRLGRALVSAGAVAVLLPAGYLISPLSGRSATITANPLLDNTFLNGWQLTGPFQYLITQAATSIDTLSKSEQAFYDKASANQHAALEKAFGAADLPRDPDVLRLAILDDLQGTSGMARIVGEAAQQVHADAVLNLGDLTATGTVQEAYLSYLKSYTVDVLAHYAGDIPVVTSLGRHDTPAVAQYAKKVHLTVADGSVQKIAGSRFIGVNSPYLVNFGSAAQLIDPAVTTDTVADGLRTAGCAEKPLAVFAHDKELLDPLTASGCVPIVIGGHSYTGEPSSTVDTAGGPVRKIILGSTGGHGEGDGFGGLSTPRNNAPFDVLTIDRRTGAVYVTTSTVHPDASVTTASVTPASLTPAQVTLLADPN